MRKIIDSHCHLDFPDFDNDRIAALKKAGEAGVSTVINIGIDVTTSRKSIDLTRENPGVFATVGFHPHDAARASDKDMKFLEELAGYEKVVAVGETGLDFYRTLSPRETQTMVFKAQLELSGKLNLPVVIHSRESAAETISLLKEYMVAHAIKPGGMRGVVHCFNGNLKTAQSYLEMGFHLAVGAYIGYPTSKMKEVLVSLPLDRLLVETDAPFLPPAERRGKRNEPAFVTVTVGLIASFLGKDSSEIAASTTTNAEKVFGLAGSTKTAPKKTVDN